MAYIDSEAFKRKLIDEKSFFPAMVARALEEMPDADVEEVVRCKDCKHAYFRYNTGDTLQEIYACRKRPAGRTHRKVSGDFFCKHGERKDKTE